MTIAMKNNGEGTPVVNETGQETTTGTTVRFIFFFMIVFRVNNC